MKKLFWAVILIIILTNPLTVSACQNNITNKTIILEKCIVTLKPASILKIYQNNQKSSTEGTSYLGQLEEISNGKIIGIINFFEKKPVNGIKAGICELIEINQEYQRNGFGRLLIQELCDFLSKAGCSQCRLTVLYGQYNIPALALYLSEGFCFTNKPNILEKKFPNETINDWPSLLDNYLLDESYITAHSVNLTLFMASSMGHYTVVKNILEQEKMLKLIDLNRATRALRVAIEKGFYSTAKLLLSNKKITSLISDTTKQWAGKRLVNAKY